MHESVSLTPGTPVTAICTTSLLNAGSNSIGASIATDSNFNPASATAITETVNTGTPVTVIPDHLPWASSTVDGAVTFTATVTPNTGVVPVGPVSFTTTLNGTTTPIAACSAVPLVAVRRQPDRDLRYQRPAGWLEHHQLEHYERPQLCHSDLQHCHPNGRAREHHTGCHFVRFSVNGGPAGDLHRDDLLHAIVHRYPNGNRELHSPTEEV